MTRRRAIWLVVGPLLGLHLLSAVAGFLAPYGQARQNRDRPFAPPTRIHFVDAAGRWHLRPFVYEWQRQDGVYREDRTRTYPVRFVVRGDPYRLAGLLPADLHLVGVDRPGRLFPLGTDGLGRDQLSRLLCGAWISLFTGLLAAAVSLAVGTAVGTLAGYYGGRLDGWLMRLTEVFMALPWLYLLIGVRGVMPLYLSPAQAFLLLVGVIGLIGWAKPARLVRSVVLSARARDYVQASRGFGASDVHLLWSHLLPETRGVILTQGALLVPRYILAEVTLSFLGLGVAEPAPSWGAMLGALQQYHVLVSYWWMFVPAVALVAVVVNYHALARLLQVRVESSA